MVETGAAGEGTLEKLLSCAEFLNGEVLGISPGQQESLQGLLTHNRAEDMPIDLGAINPEQLPEASSALTLRVNNVEAKCRLILALQYANLHAVRMLAQETASRNFLMEKIAVNIYV
jgi:hypothetical protein